MNEPDRPRRDVSIEEAERMPMTEEELDRIEADSKTDPMRHQARTILALVAEVRRLREEVLWLRTGEGSKVVRDD